MQFKRSRGLTAAFTFALFLALPAVAQAATVANPLCPTEIALFNPDSGSDIVVPAGFTVSVFKSGLNSPTVIAHGRRDQGSLAHRSRRSCQARAAQAGVPDCRWRDRTGAGAGCAVGRCPNATLHRPQAPQSAGPRAAAAA